jgi:hypothetical protein
MHTYYSTIRRAAASETWPASTAWQLTPLWKLLVRPRIWRHYLVEQTHSQFATGVTADGRVVRASTNENSDIFWALRGGAHALLLVVDIKVTQITKLSARLYSQRYLPIQCKLHDIPPLVTSGVAIQPWRVLHFIACG